MFVTSTPCVVGTQGHLKQYLFQIHVVNFVDFVHIKTSWNFTNKTEFNTYTLTSILINSGGLLASRHSNFAIEKKVEEIIKF